MFLCISLPKTPGRIGGRRLDPAPHKAPAHTSHLVRQVLTKHGTAQLQQPTCSSDLALCYFFLFPMLKNVVKDYRFEAMEDI
jgi:hypothetical protein